MIINTTTNTTSSVMKKLVEVAGTMTVKVDQSLLQNNLVELIEEPTISN